MLDPLRGFCQWDSTTIKGLEYPDSLLYCHRGHAYLIWNLVSNFFGCHGYMMVAMEMGPPRFFPDTSLTCLCTTSAIRGVHELWESFLVAMATVVKVTRFWIFFSPMGTKGQLHAKSHGDQPVNNWETAWLSHHSRCIILNGWWIPTSIFLLRRRE